MPRRFGGRPGSGSVRSTTLETLGEQSRRQVGPTILFDRPRPGAPAPHFIRFPVGRPAASGSRDKPASRSNVRVGRAQLGRIPVSAVPTEKNKSGPVKRRAALRRSCRDASLHARTSAELPPPSRLQSTPQSWRSRDTSPDPSPSSHTRSESPHGPLALASKS
jgi:hypothetical protein